MTFLQGGPKFEVTPLAMMCALCGVCFWLSSSSSVYYQQNKYLRTMQPSGQLASITAYKTAACLRIPAVLNYER